MFTSTSSAELDPAEAAASDPTTGELKYNWSNICLHYFCRDWLEAVSDKLAEMGRYHIARKQIPSMHGPVAVSGGRWGHLPACLHAWPLLSTAALCPSPLCFTQLLLPIRCFAC
jgi:hypothetical protein